MLPQISPPLIANAAAVNVFLDATGSMKDFMTQNTEFQFLLPDLLSRLQRNLPNSTYFFALSQAGVPIQSFSIKDACRAIADHNFKFGNATTLPSMLDAAVARLTPNSISIVITDAIYSPPKPDSNLKFQEAPELASVFA